MNRPKIQKFETLQAFFKAWFEFLKSVDSKFSLRKLSSESKVSFGYLSGLQNGKIKITSKALKKLMPSLRLYPSEESYLKNWTLSMEEKDLRSQVAAVGRLTQFSNYKEKYPGDAEVYQYLSHWYYLVIRELSDCEDFSMDPKWIQSRLNWSVSISEIERALRFLKKNGFLEVDSKGNVQKPERKLECRTGVFQAGLLKMHLDLLAKAEQSLLKEDSENRYFEGLTIALNKKDLPKVREIVGKALDEISELAHQSSNKSEQVYHTEICLFPLSSVETGGLKNEK